MTFTEDADAVRAYLRGPGRMDYVLLRQVDDATVEVQFSANLDRHEDAVTAQLSDPSHVRVVAGRLRQHRRDELADQYWDERRREEVFAAWHEGGQVRELSFGYDDDGPFLALGLRPHTEASVNEAVAMFAPHRVRTFEGPDVVALQ